MRIVAALVLALLIAGCSNHPIIRDVTGYSTYDVVHKVRCEAREALDAYSKRNGFDLKRQEIKRIQDKFKEDRKALDDNVVYGDLKSEVVILNSKIDESKKKLVSVKLDVRGLQLRLEELLREKTGLG